MLTGRRRVITTRERGLARGRRFEGHIGRREGKEGVKGGCPDDTSERKRG